MSSTNYSVYDTVSPTRNLSRIVSHQTLPQRGISPLVVPGGTYRASTIPPHTDAGFGGDARELAYYTTSRSRSPLRSPTVPTTHPRPRGGATPSSGKVRSESGGGGGGGFTDLRYSPAQRKKGTYGDGYCTIGRGLMRNLVGEGGAKRMLTHSCYQSAHSCVFTRSTY